MPLDAEQYTGARAARRAISQTTISSHFAAGRSQALSINRREGSIASRLLLTKPAAGNLELSSGATSIDLEEWPETASICSRRRPPSDTGLPTRLQRLSLTPHDTAFEYGSLDSTRLLKRKAEATQERDIAPSKRISTLDVTLFSRRRGESYQQSNDYNTNTRNKPGRISRRTFAANIEVIDSDSDLECSSTSASYRQDPQLIELDNQSDEDNSDYDFQVTGAQRAVKKPRLVTIPKVLDPNKRSVEVHSLMASLVRQGTVVELADSTFMRIHKIYQDDKEGHLLVGHMFVRAGTFSPRMPLRRDDLKWQRTNAGGDVDNRLPSSYKGGELINEVVQKVRIFAGENATDYGLWRRSIGDVIGLRDMKITNRHYNDINCVTSNHLPAGSSRLASLATLAKLRKEGTLHCRWKDVTIHNRYGKWQEQRLERPTYQECDEHWAEASESLREAWGGLITPLTADTKPLFADGFCGAGGVSQGAKQAGLKIVFSFDHDSKKIVTYRNNYPDCQSLVLDVFQFITLAQEKGWKVHVLHFSPPCQPYSQANVSPNAEKNERNQAPLLGCADVIKALRPRIVTVEETIGIENRHHPWFYALLHQFTEIGFSVAWSKLNCAEFGVPQSRQRLILIAAAPGEDLPPFPEPTHPRGSISIASALHELEKAHRESPLTHHDTSVQYATPKPPFDPYRLAATITCSGGVNNYHPSGLRNYTPREFAALQTFPPRYNWPTEFSVTEIRQQNGNAVPPLLAKAALQSVVKSLKATDRRRLTALRNEAQRDAIDLTADSDGDCEADTTSAVHQTYRVCTDLEI